MTILELGWVRKMKYNFLPVKYNFLPAGVFFAFKYN